MMRLTNGLRCYAHCFVTNKEFIDEMGAVPKTKISRHRRGNRRQHLRLDEPTLVPCTNCKALMRAHHVCKNCGQYRGRQVVQMAEREDSE